MDTHFNWYKAELDKLEAQLVEIVQQVNGLPLGDEWGVIEPVEKVIADSVQRLGLIRFFDRHFVPVRRLYTWADDSPMERVWANGDDGWNHAIKARITIASPKMKLLTAIVSAPWARGRRPEDGCHEQFHLEPLDAPWIRAALLHVLDEWRELVIKTRNTWEPQPEIRARRLALQIGELHSEIESHRMDLISCERLLRDAGAFKPDAPRDRIGNPVSEAGLIWSQWAPVIHGNHQRLTAHLNEMLADATGISAELQYGLGDQAGPTETRLIEILRDLHQFFSRLAADQLGREDLLTCGYHLYHLDGAHDLVKKWWLKLEQPLRKAAATLEAVALAPIVAAMPNRPEPSQSRFNLDGAGWRVSYGGESGYFTGLGFATIHHLLVASNSPVESNRRISALDLLRIDDRGAVISTSPHGVMLDAGGHADSYQAATDRQGFDDIRRRKSELDAELEKIDRNDPSRGMIQQELDELIERAKQDYLSDGRVKDINNQITKQIDTVWKRIRRAYAQMRTAGQQKTADHFEQAINQAGGIYSYVSQPRVEWDS